MDDNKNIIKNLEYMPSGQIHLICNGEMDGFLHRAKGKYCVAIEDTKGIDDFEERFVGITITTDYINYQNKSKKVIYMYISDKEDLDKFSIIAEDFLSIANRNELLNNTFDWINSWRNLFGDTIKKKKVFDVIGEMLVFKYIYAKDKTAVWAGPSSGSQDIVSQYRNFEVKSTTIKVGNVVHISSAFQLDVKKQSELYFVRLEKKDYALTIDSLANDIVNMGYDRTKIETCLCQLGYPVGNKDRKKSYDVLEIKKYSIDETNFPIMTLADINKITKSKNIIGYVFTVDLSNLFGEDVVVK